MSKKQKILELGYYKYYKVIFLNGKQKKIKMEYMDGIPLYDWYEQNQDDIAKIENGDYESIIIDQPSYNVGLVNSVNETHVGTNDELPF